MIFFWPNALNIFSHILYLQDEPKLPKPWASEERTLLDQSAGQVQPIADTRHSEVSFRMISGEFTQPSTSLEDEERQPRASSPLHTSTCTLNNLYLFSSTVNSTANIFLFILIFTEKKEAREEKGGRRKTERV